MVPATLVQCWLPACSQGSELATLRSSSEYKMTFFAPLVLHVPEPAVRPGGTPTFDIEIPRAGSVRRPDLDVAPEEIRDLAYTIIRVLDDEGNAVGPWAGLLSDGEVLEGLRHMM